MHLPGGGYRTRTVDWRERRGVVRPLAGGRGSPVWLTVLSGERERARPDTETGHVEHDRQLIDGEAAPRDDVGRERDAGGGEVGHPDGDLEAGEVLQADHADRRT